MGKNQIKTVEVLNEFVEASQWAPSIYDNAFESIAQRFVLNERARRMKAYRKLHQNPIWRAARAAKMRAYRARLKASQ